MTVRLEKPWRPADAATIAALPGQLGVYQVASAAGEVLAIGFAGGREPFGLRSAVARAVEATGAAQFRVEVNMQYQSRYRELLAVHLAEHGTLPPGNPDDPARIGRITVH